MYVYEDFYNYLLIMSNNQRINSFKTKLDYRIILIFAFFLITALIILFIRMNNRVDCENLQLLMDSKNYLANEEVKFKSNIVDAKEWEWDFGDGTPISKSANPVHKYIVSGKYFVRLTVNGSCYAEKEIVIKNVSDLVLHETVPEIIAPDVVRVGDPITFDYYFADESKDIFSWEWSFGETGDLDKAEKNPIYIFQTPGQKRVSLIINGDARYISSKNVFVKPREPVINSFQYKQRIREEVALDPGLPQKDPVDEHVMGLPIAPTPISMIEQPAFVQKKAPEISNEQFEILLLKVAEQSKTKEDFSEYLCENYEIPVVKNQKELMTFADFCLGIKGKDIRVESLTLLKDPVNNCVVSMNVNYKIKKNLMWLKD